MNESGLDILLWVGGLILAGAFFVRLSFRKGKEGAGFLAFLFSTLVICLVGGVMWMALFSEDLTRPIFFSVLVLEACSAIGAVVGYARCKNATFEAHT